MKSDLHNHIYVTWEQGKLSLQRKPRTLEYIADLAIENGLGILGITSHGQSDNRFSKLKETISTLSKKYEVSDLGSVIEIYDLPRRLIIVNSRTVPTKQGDVLLIGEDFPFKDNADITNTLKKAKGLGMITIAEHMFVEEAGGIGQKVFEANAEYFDAIEINGQAPKKYNQQAIKYATEIGKPLIANSDSHTPKDIASTYTKYESGFFLIYKSDYEFIEKLNSAIKKPLGITVKGTPFLRKASWISILIYDAFIRRKTGLLPFQETKSRFKI